MTRPRVRFVRSVYVDELSVGKVFADGLQSLLITGSVKRVQPLGAQQAFLCREVTADVVVLNRSVELSAEQLGSLPIGGEPEFETSQPCVRGTIGVLVHPIAELSEPTE